MYPAVKVVLASQPLPAAAALHQPVMSKPPFELNLTAVQTPPGALVRSTVAGKLPVMEATLKAGDVPQAHPGDAPVGKVMKLLTV